MGDETTKNDLVPARESGAELPPILMGRHTEAVEARVRGSYQSAAQFFERRAARRSGAHTRRDYRRDALYQMSPRRLRP